MGWTRCVNPFNYHGAAVLFNTRTISTEFQLKCDIVLGQGYILQGQQLCSKCYGTIRNRYDIIKHNEISSQENMVDMEPIAPYEEDDTITDVINSRVTERSFTGTTATTQSSHCSIAIEDAKFNFNACLLSLNISPMKSGLSNTQEHTEFKEKCLSILDKVKEIIQCLSPQSIDIIPNGKCKSCEALTYDIQKKFVNMDSKKERFQLATCLPRSLQISEIMTLLNVTSDMAKKISRLRNMEGAFSFFEPKQRQKISLATIQKVKQHYLSPWYSKTLPGQWDTVYADKDSKGNKERVAKQLMLVTLTELHSEFVQQNPDNPISLSEFAKHKPRQCRWVWNKGQHRNCTCIIHENFKLLLEATCSSKIGSKTQQIIGDILCEDTQTNCWLGLCEFCPRNEEICALFSEIDDDDEISFYQWVSTDRTDIVQLTESATDFCDRIRRYIPKIALHCYIHRTQHEFIENLKTKLVSEKSIIAHIDFGQNYTFLIQDAVQSYHWSPPQATIHPFVLQYYDIEMKVVDEVKYVVISDCLEHNAATFYCFHHEVMVEMNKLVPDLEKVYFVSDGSAAQYKGYKSFCNLLYHEKDFNVKCEHHFHATAHGKSSCDAASGICKHNARQASKRGEKIATPLQFYNFCRNKLASDKFKFLFISKERIQDIVEEKNLNERYSKAMTIPGSRSAHAFIPSSEWPIMLVKQFSSAENGIEYSILEGENKPHNIRPEEDQFVAFVFDNIMRVGRVIKTDVLSGDVKVVPLLNTTGKNANRFKDKDFPVELWINNSALLCIIEPPMPTTASRREYQLQEKDFVKSCRLFEMRV